MRGEIRNFKCPALIPTKHQMNARASTCLFIYTVVVSHYQSSTTDKRRQGMCWVKYLNAIGCVERQDKKVCAHVIVK